MRTGVAFRIAAILFIAATFAFVSPLRDPLERRENDAWLAWADSKDPQKEAAYLAAAGRLKALDATILTVMVGSYLFCVAIAVRQGLRQRSLKTSSLTQSS